MTIDALRVFLKVAELASFTRAGEHLGLSKARVSVKLAELEGVLGTRLVQRSTRAVRLTPDGEELLPRARQLVEEADELATLFEAPTRVRGRVRVDLPQSLARGVLIPALPELLAANPGLEVQMSSTDRRVDLVREGFDCVLRIGKLGDSGLVARRLGSFDMMNAASPSYVKKHGTPRTLDDLDHHYLVHYSLRFGADTPGFEHKAGDVYRDRPMRALVTVNSGDSYTAACLAGLGIIQAPAYGLRPRIAAGDMVEVLREHTAEPMPVSLVHAHGRNVPRHVRAVMGWIAEKLEPHLDA
jgi:DNA-binding transcriptional LysR family regulator